MVFVMYVWYGRYFQIPCTCCALDRCSSTRKHPFSAHGDSKGVDTGGGGGGGGLWGLKPPPDFGTCIIL